MKKFLLNLSVENKISLSALLFSMVSLIISSTLAFQSSSIQKDISAENQKMKILEITYKDKRNSYTDFLFFTEQYSILSRSKTMKEIKAFKINLEELKTYMMNSLHSLAIYTTTEKYKDFKKRTLQIIHSSEALFSSNIGASYLSDERKNIYLTTLNENVIFLQAELRSSLLKAKP